MKSLKFYQLLLLACLVFVTISCEKNYDQFLNNSQLRKSNKSSSEQLNLNALNKPLTDSLEKIGYVKQTKLSTADIVCYIKNDTTKIINLNANLTSKNSKRSISSGFAMFKMYGNVNILSGVMSAQSDDIDDTGSNLPDLAFNCRSLSWRTVETVGLMIFDTQQGTGRLWGYPGGSFVTIKVWESDNGGQSGIGNLEDAIAVDPVGSFIRLE